MARPDHGDESARGLTFATLVVASLMIILVNRSWTRSLAAIVRVPNAAFGWVVGGTLALVGAILFVPLVRARFHFGPLHLDDVGLSAAAGAASLLWFEVVKRFWRSS